MTDIYSENELQRIFRKELTSVFADQHFRIIVREEITGEFVDQQIRAIVREEIANSPTIISMQTDISHVKTAVQHLGVLFEDLSSKFDTLLEVAIDSAKIMNRLDGHEGRIIAVENAQKLLTKTVTAHSRQLKAT